MRLTITRFILRFLLGVLALFGIGTYVGLALQRMPYPLELDCIEGVMMDHVVRLANGQPIYVEPTLHFIPLAYMPGFAALSSLVTRAAHEPALWQPRLVSVVASFLLLLLIVLVVRGETKRPFFALGAAGVFAMGYGYTGGCYDIARPDTLMLLLAFAGLALLRRTTGGRGAVAAGLVMTLAFFTKQHAALFVLGALAHLAVNDRRRLLPFGLTVMIGCGGGYALLTAWLGEWFPVFTWSIPRGWSEVDRGRIQHYVSHGLIGVVGAFLIPLVLSLGSRRRPWAGRPGIWAWTALASVGIGLMATLDASAYRHLFVPTLAGFAIAGPVALHALTADLESVDAPGPVWSECAALLVFLMAFVPLLYSARTQLPHRRALEAHHELVARLTLIEGDLLMPFHGWYAHHAGHETSLQIIPLDDIERSRGNLILERDPEFLERMFAPLREGPNRPTIITDLPLEENGPLWASIASGYVVTDTLGWLTAALRPITGNQFSPRLVYSPRDPLPGAAEPGPGRAERDAPR